MRTSNTWKQKYELEKEKKGLLVVVMGDSNYEFRLGNWRCGEATAYGMSANKQGSAGGVIPLDEVVRLRDFLNKHINQVVQKKWYQFWK